MTRGETYLTQAQMREIAEKLLARRRAFRRCPWNPFPPKSEWGREIDNRYNFDPFRRRSLATLKSLEVRDKPGI